MVYRKNRRAEFDRALRAVKAELCLSVALVVVGVLALVAQHAPRPAASTAIAATAAAWHPQD
ncbi:MAG TPA: hypothetical protein VGM20_14370 [Gemmatimonadales bacterium]